MSDQNGAINWLLGQKRIQASASVRNGNATVNHEEIVGFIDLAIAALTPRHEAPAAPVETLGETAWDDVDIEDLLSDAIGDSIDLGWSSRDGAKAALAALKKEGLLIFPTQPDTGKGEASGSERGIVLDWRKVETTALEEWRAEFGDYAAIVTLGHDNVWSYRINNSGHLGFASADEAKQQALTALTKRLTARLAAARETVALYDALRPAPVASGGQHSSATDFLPGEVTDEWAERFCEAVNWSPDGQECKAVEGQVRCVSFRDLAKGYILSAIATQPAITSVTPPVAETAGEAHEARAIRLQAALDAAIAADDGLARAAAAEAQLDRLVDYLAGHLNGLRVGRKEAVDTVIVNLTKLIEAQATTPPVPAPSTDKLRIAVEALERIADEAPYRSGYCQSDVDYAPKLSDKEMQAVAQAALSSIEAEGA